MNKQEILEKQKRLANSQSLLNLANHQATNDYVIVVPIEIREPGITTHVTQWEDRPNTGFVLSSGHWAAESGINPGDVVFFGEYSHTKIVHDGVTYLVMRAEDIYLVANDN